MGSFIMLTVVLGGELVGRGELLALVVVVVSVERLLSVARLWVCWLAGGASASHFRG
jgi:hypothetical protein